MVRIERDNSTKMSHESRYGDAEFLHGLATSGQFDRLVRYLASNEPLGVRRRAAALLAECGDGIDGDDELKSQLITVVLRETDDTVRAKSIETLLSIEDGVIDALVDRIESNAEPTPTDSPHPILFFHWLDSQHAVLRELALAGLGRVATNSIIPRFADACDDPDPHVRKRALEECASVGDRRCVDAVADCLDSDREAIRTAAVEALTEIGTDDAIATLLSAAEHDTLAVRRTVLRELGAVGSPVVFGCLLHGVAGGPESIRDVAVTAMVELIAEAPAEESHIVRETVATQLATLPDHDIVPRTIELVDDAEQPSIRRNAAWLLGRIADDEPRQSVIDCLIRTLRDTDGQTRKIAASNLARIDEPAVIDHIEAFIKSNDLRSEALSRADFVRDRITEERADDKLKDTVEYTQVSDPAEYTTQKRERDAG
ncbi:MAG: HEAT repeat protein [uncultured archaeon A07HN63]|nr:MAG: HEAT repeat protein [uncultured archaeon A07HN63]